MAAIEDRKDVQWLFDRLDEATSTSEIDNVVFVIKLETSDENEYTKDADVMDRLRRCFAKNRARVKSNEQAKESKDQKSNPSEPPSQVHRVRDDEGR